MNQSFKLRLIFASIVVGVLISLFQIAHQSSHIVDTFIYLKTAIRFQDEGFSSAIQHYYWPFYSCLIAWCQTLTGLSMVNAGYLTNIVMQSLLVLMFLLCVARFHDDKKTLLAGAILILLYSKFNSLRPELFRDFPYWTCLLTALWSVFCYVETKRLRFVVLASLMTSLSILFRIEGIVFAFLFPLIYLFFDQPPREKLKSTVVGLAVPLICFLSIILGLIMQPGRAMGRLSSFHHYLSTYFSRINHHFAEKTQFIHDHVLLSLNNKYSYVLLLAGLLVLFVLTLIKSLTPTYGFLSLYGMAKHIKSRHRDMNVALFGYVMINLVICVAYFADRYFIIARYFIALNLGLLIWLSVALSDLWRESFKGQQKSRIQPLFLVGVCLGLFTMGLKSVDRHFSRGMFLWGQSKTQHIEQAGKWLHQQLGDGADLVSNNQNILFYASHDKRQWLSSYAPYSRRFNASSLFTHEHLWLAIDINQHNRAKLTELVNNSNYQIVQTFENYRQDKVLILNKL